MAQEMGRLVSKHLQILQALPSVFCEVYIYKTGIHGSPEVLA